MSVAPDDSSWLLYQAALKLIKALKDMEPEEGTPEAYLLDGLIAATLEYERDCEAGRR